MMRRLIVTLFQAFILSGCATANMVDTAEEEEVPLDNIFPNNPQVLACAPATLSSGQTLTLTLGPGHGRELAIVRESDETPYFLVVQGPPPDMRSLMLRDLFAVASRVDMPASITGYKWIGDGGNERIFTSPGEYVVIVSDNLEGEAGGNSCAIDYRG